MADSVAMLVDTDIGTTIDDALALAYLLRQPRCELLGITTVAGDVAKRVAVANALCQAARRSIPIFAGLSGPATSDVSVPEFDAMPALAPSRPSEVTAVDFLWQTISSRPGDVTLLSLGPLTNVARLFETYPESPRLLKAWVSMAGDFDGRGEPEWNCRLDPSSAARAFALGEVAHTHLGLNVTERCKLPVRALLPGQGDPLFGLLLQLGRSHPTNPFGVKMHDPLAAAVVFRPDLCRYERGRVSVDASSGATSFQADECGSDLVAFDVDSEEASAEYANVVLRGNSANI